MAFATINKLAFICNLAFITAMLMRYYPFMQGTATESVVLVTGLVLSPVVNIVLNILFVLMYVKKRPVHKNFLLRFNQVVLAVQLLLILSGSLSLSNI